MAETAWKVKVRRVLKVKVRGWVDGKLRTIRSETIPLNMEE
jgi:hypothetical protein